MKPGVKVGGNKYVRATFCSGYIKVHVWGCISISGYVHVNDKFGLIVYVHDNVELILYVHDNCYELTLLLLAVPT